MAYYLGHQEAGPSSRKHNTRLVENATSGPAIEDLLEVSHTENIKVTSMIQNKLPGLKIKKVKKVQNNFLEAMYLLKKDEYMSRYKSVNEMVLFHATGAGNVSSITKNNFDWRRISRGKFGLGTSFSDDPAYANRYANKNIGNDRVFIVAKVLVSNKTFGREGLKVPPLKFDTATGNGNKVYVKFCDNEVLPQYIAYYNNAGLSTHGHTYLHHHGWDDSDDYDLLYDVDFCGNDLYGDDYDLDYDVLYF